MELVAQQWYFFCLEPVLPRGIPCWACWRCVIAVGGAAIALPTFATELLGAYCSWLAASLFESTPNYACSSLPRFHPTCSLTRVQPSQSGTDLMWYSVPIYPGIVSRVRKSKYVPSRWKRLRGKVCFSCEPMEFRQSRKKTKKAERKIGE